MIDLRSDTVSKPTAEMRQAMAEAEVGDAAYGEDPTVNRLQERAAQMLGMEAALYVPSGTMANQIAVAIHVRPGDEVILDGESHIFNKEVGMMAAFAGALAKTIPTVHGILPIETVEEAIIPTSRSESATGLICLENTHNRKGGTIYPLDEMRALIELAHSQGLPIHLDGARILNASVATGTAVTDLVSGFDSVMFCLSKGLGAPVGSLLLGSTTFIEEAHRVRRMLGGAMRQAGIIAGGGLYALEHHIERLAQDHDNAKLLTDALRDKDQVALEPVQTNIVMFTLDGIGAENFAEQMRAKGILVNVVSSKKIRLVTHLDVNHEQALTAADAMNAILR